MGVLRELLDELRSWRDSSPTPRRLLLQAAAAGQQEHPDPTPVAIPIGQDRPDTMREMVQAYVRQEISAVASERGMGTFEEEDDFEAEDPSELPLTGFEVTEYAMEDEPGPLDDPPPATPAAGPTEPPSTPAEPPQTEATPPTATPQ